MKPTLRLFMAGSLVAFTAWLVAQAAQADPPPQRTSGRVLLLENDRALEGEIAKRGNQYHIRRELGEVWIPVEKAQRLCADWNEAFEAIKQQANLHDADERLRLARWCVLHSLREQGLIEVQAVLKQRPQHAEAKHLLTILQRDPKAEPPAPASLPVLSRPSLDLDAESQASFITRVQPILMNACMNCHATGRGGEFKLMRSLDGQLNHKATQDNLAAVLTRLRLDQPEMSPLLIKAVSLHGATAQAPLPGRTSLPFKTLNDWVLQVAANNPHLRKETGLQQVAAVNKPPVSPEVAPPRLAPAPAPKSATLAESSPPTRINPDPPAGAAAADEFDPGLFNRLSHPGRKN